MPVALVLSGGGARGNFQLGAVRYLYERGLRPDIICGCSVGAINGAKLAESAEPLQALAALEAIWLRLQQNSDMWEEERWFTELTNIDLKEWAFEAMGTYFIVPPVGLLVLLVKAGLDLDDFLSRLRGAKSLFNLGPIARLLANPSNFDPEKVRRSGIKLRLAVVALESGTLRYVTETGEVLERKQDERLMGPALVLAAPCQRIADELARLQSELLVQVDAINGEPLPGLRRAESLALEIQEQQRKLAECVAQHHGGRLTVRLRDGVLASASIPVAFPPVRLGGEHYVDGGVREILPLEAALDAGADEVIAVVASTAGVPPATTLDHRPLSSFASGTVLDVTKRVAQEIMPDETLFNETDPPGGWPATVTVIQPSLFPDIHDVMTIDPGLIRIQVAHGYMRADDVMQARARSQRESPGEPGRYRALADELSETRKTNQIIRVRKALWELEHTLHDRIVRATRKGAAQTRFRATLLEEVRAMKRDLRRLIEERRRAGGALPAEPDQWWQEWEQHPWPTRGRGPWEDRAAAFVRQSLPERMVAGRRYQASITMRNVGLDTWTPGGTNPYRLGSQNPQDNRTWGPGRVELSSPVPFDGEATFRFSVTAPATAGRHNFRWRMVQEAVAWFGDLTPNISVQVVPPHLRVTVEPHPVPLNVSTRVLVRAMDSESGAPVAGHVLIDGQPAGNTNTPFSYTFRLRLGGGETFTRSLALDAGERFAEPTTSVVAPSGVVKAAGYPDVAIDFGIGGI